MNLLDKKFKKNITRYIIQCLMATITILIILNFLDLIKHTAIIASLGATAFIVFTMPRTYSSRPRPLLGGYLVGITVGCCFHYVSEIHSVQTLLLNNGELTMMVFGGLSVGLAIFIMTATNTEHAPASGIALGLIINEWDYRTLIFIFSAALLMFLVKRMAKPLMIDLM